MAKPKYNVTVPIDTADGGTYWHKIGAGWVNDRDQISVTLNSYPLPNKEGQVKFFLFENKEEDRGAAKPRYGARQGVQDGQAPTSYAEELDDEIPF